jgi:hypothetical protein
MPKRKRNNRPPPRIRKAIKAIKAADQADAYAVTIATATSREDALKALAAIKAARNKTKELLACVQSEKIPLDTYEGILAAFIRADGAL